MTVQEQAGIPSMFGLLTQKRLRWLGHIRRMDDVRILKELLYGGSDATGSRPHEGLSFAAKTFVNEI